MGRWRSGPPMDRSGPAEYADDRVGIPVGADGAGGEVWPAWLYGE